MSEEFKRGSVKIVRATFRNQVDNRALRLPKLGAETVTLNAKLLNRIDRRRIQQRAVRADVHVVDAIDGPQIRV